MWQALTGNACTISNPEGAVVTLNCLPILVGNIIFWLLLLAGVTALLLIIYSGLKFVTSGGDAKKAEGARRTLTFAIAGLFLVLFSFAIVRVLGEITGVKKNCINRFGFTQCVPDDISHPCGDFHPNGFCSGDQSCVRVGGPDEFACKTVCSNAHRNGYCYGTMKCTRIEANFYSCRPRN